ETMATLRGIRRRFPEMILCLASNGMGIGPYVAELAELAVSHVTITVNTVDPEIGAEIYSWVSDGNVLYRGIQGADLLLARQLAAIRSLKAHGITVKINTIVVPGINDDQIEMVAATMQELGVDLLNCMALFPNIDTPFGDLPQPGKEEMAAIRAKAEKYLPQMRHCTRCRADAVGLLGEDRTEEFRGCLSACATLPKVASGDERPYVAVATQEGVLVNQHLGEAERFQIWARNGANFRLVEERATPESGGGIRRWLRMGKLLGDCRAVLVSGIGDKPREILIKTGVQPVEMNGFIEAGLTAVYDDKKVEQLKARKVKCAGGGCSGGGSGCV
ncbi:MAG TPA: NifB/NifX family molybdenum-iron cluster-binding protein, partial [Desulfurivibrionaceae bacterium]|nr:NifB/NifX family molybdenum-iron cluster-binding protein [Desulfurivibrionaceae bacterium]